MQFQHQQYPPFSPHQQLQPQMSLQPQQSPTARKRKAPGAQPELESVGMSSAGLVDPGSIGQQQETGLEPAPVAPTPKKSRTNTPWTPAEEQLLRQLRDAGNSWGEIAKVRRKAAGVTRL